MDKPSLHHLDLSQLTAHPDNPRLLMREDVIEGIAVQLRTTKHFSEMYAPIVRPADDTYQIISGHHRIEAARRAEITTIPCWVSDMDDDTAYMQLVLANSQGELSPLEMGIHALGATERYGRNGSGLKGYASAVGKQAGHITELTQAAKVFQSLPIERFAQANLFREKAKHLTTIHKTPEHSWQALADALISADWTVKETEAAVKRVNDLLGAIPAWWPIDTAPLVQSAIRNETQAIVTTLKRITDLDVKLGTVTIYHYQDTDTTEERDGRLYRRMDAYPSEYDQRGIYRQRLIASASIPDSKHALAVYTEILHYTQGHMQQGERWIPVMTDEEYQAEQHRIAELQASERRGRFTPTIHHSDVMRALQRIPSSSVDLIVCDPPYNIDKTEWDTIGTPQQYIEWATPWIKECHRVLKNSGSIYVFGYFRMLKHLSIAMDAIGLCEQDDITWDTIQGAGGGFYVNRKETILFYTKTQEYYKNPDAVRIERHEEHIREYRGQEYRFKNVSNIWRIPCVDDKAPDRTDHPTQKPVVLIERIIRASSPHEGRILDPFIGSGTTGVACMQLERECIGIEREQAYIDIALARFDQTSVGVSL